MSEALTPSDAAPAPETALPPSGATSPAPESPTPEVPLPGADSILATVQSEEPASASEEAPAGAPEAYIDFTLPEGLTVEPELMTAFQETAKSNGLSQEAAQGFLDLYSKTVQTQVSAMAQHLTEQQQQAWADTNKAWLAELEAVPDFQGDNKKTALATVAKALDEYGVGDVRGAFALTGAGNNPAIVQTFLRMARALSESPTLISGSPPSGPRTTGAILYGDSPST